MSNLNPDQECGAPALDDRPGIVPAQQPAQQTAMIPC